MADFDVKVEDHTAEAKDQLAEAKEIALNVIGAMIEARAKLRTPVGTPESTGIKGYMGGTLRNSITFVTSKHSGETIKVEPGSASPTAENHGGEKQQVPAGGDEDTVYVGTNVYYAPYVEYGHHSYPAKHFLKNAIDDHKGFYISVWESILKKFGENS